MCVEGIRACVFEDDVSMLCCNKRCHPVSPNNKVVELENSKNIGATPRIMAKGGGRFNTMEENLDRYLMSQSFVVKAGDFFFTNPEDTKCKF